jgi:N-acetyl-gamma-glutamyl-phosphate reductase
MVIKASIIGATGYTGLELARILSLHPEVELKILTSQSHVGEDIADIYPSLRGRVRKLCQEQDLNRVLEASHVVFIALPHGHSVPVVKEAISRGKKVIDLGADFRLGKAEVYEEWYQVKHEAPELLPEAVYGLPEIYREKISEETRIIANPGCYPTAAILALAPALTKKLIKPESIIIDAKSGVSGAGRKLSLSSHFSEVNESIRAYGVASHRHTPEIEQELQALAGREFRISFTPHLAPMTRGILVTAYGQMEEDLSLHQVREIYASFYAGEPFVHLLAEEQWPQTKWVYGSNRCLINLTVDKRTRRLVVCSVIDNLVKGASGQAVQNMNLLFGLPETLGLEFNALFP